MPGWWLGMVAVNHRDVSLFALPAARDSAVAKTRLMTQKGSTLSHYRRHRVRFVATQNCGELLSKQVVRNQPSDPPFDQSSKMYEVSATQYNLVYDVLSFVSASMAATTIFCWMRVVSPFVHCLLPSEFHTLSQDDTPTISTRGNHLLTSSSNFTAVTNRTGQHP